MANAIMLKQGEDTLKATLQPTRNYNEAFAFNGMALNLKKLAVTMQNTSNTNNLWAVEGAPDLCNMDDYGTGYFAGQGVVGNNNYIYSDGSVPVSTYGWRGYGLAQAAGQRAARMDSTGGVVYDYLHRDPPHGGFIVQFTAGGSTTRAVSRQIQLEAGKSYFFSFWFTGQAKGFDIKALSQIKDTHQSNGDSIITSASADIKVNTNTFSTLGTWGYIIVHFTMPADKSVANFILSEGYDTSAGFDEFSLLEEDSQLKDIFKNCSFKEVELQYEGHNLCDMNGAFNNATELKKATIHNSFEHASNCIGTFANDDNLEVIDGNLFGEVLNDNYWGIPSDSTTHTFYQCEKLKDISFLGNLNLNSLSLEDCPLLSKGSLVSIANGLNDQVYAFFKRNLKLHSSAVATLDQCFGTIENGSFVLNDALTELWAVPNAPDQCGVEAYNVGVFAGEFAAGTSGFNSNYIYGQNPDGTPKATQVSPYGWRGYGLAAQNGQRAARYDYTGTPRVNYYHSGTAGLRVQFLSETRAVSRQIQLEAGESYTLCFWFKGKTQNFDVKALTQIEDTHQSSGDSIITSINYDLTRDDNDFSDVTSDKWGRVKVEFTMPQDKSVANFIFAEGYGFDMAFDEFTLYKGNAVSLKDYILFNKKWELQYE